MYYRRAYWSIIIAATMLSLSATACGNLTDRQAEQIRAAIPQKAGEAVV